MTTFGDTGGLENEGLQEERMARSSRRSPRTGWISTMTATPAPSASVEQGRRIEAERLQRVIEGEIVPRLLLAHSDPGWPAPRLVADDDVEELARIAVVHDADTALRYVSALCEAGLTPDVARVSLLAPAARLLGELWEADRCTFAEVSLGLSRLQQVLRALAIDEPAMDRVRLEGGTILVAPTPGDQHAFGAQMAADFLERDGWDVRFLAAPAARELRAFVRTQPVSTVVLSVACDFLLDATRSLLTAMRADAGRRLACAVGGAALDRADDFDVGADLVARHPADLLNFVRRRTAARRVAQG